MMVFEQFRKSYGHTEVIGIPGLRIKKGIYWLRGENGSGKSTLMRSVAGLLPYHGNVTVNDTNIRTNRIAYTSMVNYAEAEPLFPGFLTGNDLIRFYAESKKAPAGQAEDLCRQLGVHTYAANRIATYSSGMAKKLSLVLGFMGTPQLVLLDEPLITLDVASTATLQHMIATQHQAGVSFIISSHQELQAGDVPIGQLFIRNKTLETV